MSTVAHTNAWELCKKAIITLKQPKANNIFENIHYSVSLPIKGAVILKYEYILV